MEQEGSKRFLSFSHIITELFKAEGDTCGGREEFVGGNRTGIEDMGRLGSGYLMGKL